MDESFQACLKRVLELNADFVDRCGKPLFMERHATPSPFLAAEPFSWFVGCVSFLSCLFFDAAKKTPFSVLAGFKIDEGTKQIVANDDETFLDDLRLLRTYFQHSLDPTLNDDKREIDRAVSWLRQSSGTNRDGCDRYTARTATAVLIQQLESFVADLVTVTASVWDASEEVQEQMRYKLGRAERKLAEHEVRRAIDEVVYKQGINVEPSEVVRIYQTNIMSEVSGSSCLIEKLGEELLRVCEKFCRLLERTPPSIGKMRAKLGLEGREIGECARQLEQEWNADLRMSVEDYFARAEQIAEDLQQKRASQ